MTQARLRLIKYNADRKLQFRNVAHNLCKHGELHDDINVQR